MQIKLKHFENEDEAKQIASLELRDLLNNSQFIYPDKFSQLIGDYRKKQSDLDTEITISIKTQVNSLFQSQKAKILYRINNKNQSIVLLIL